MTRCKKIYIISLLLFNSLYCMERIVSEPISIATPSKSEKNTKWNTDYTLYKELFFTYSMRTTAILIKKITNYILCYSTLIHNKEFEEKRYAKKWKEALIPSFYHHLLTPEQLSLTTELLLPTSYLMRLECNQCEIHYHLKSQKGYKLFLTLPVEMRLYLTKLPLLEISNNKKTFRPLSHSTK